MAVLKNKQCQRNAIFVQKRNGKSGAKMLIFNPVPTTKTVSRNIRKSKHLKNAFITSLVVYTEKRNNMVDVTFFLIKNLRIFLGQRRQIQNIGGS